MVNFIFCNIANVALSYRISWGELGFWYLTVFVKVVFREFRRPLAGFWFLGASGGLQTACVFRLVQELSIKTLVCIWWWNYEIYDIFYPSVSVLASLFSLSSCLIDILITGLCLYAGDACLLWMNFNIVSIRSCWIYHASLSSFAYDSVVIFLMNAFPVCSQSSQPKNIPETL